MVPWSHLRHPFLGRMRTDLTSELTHFNLAIRLRKVKQLAIPFSTFYNVSPLLLSLRQLGTFIFTLVKPIRTARNLFFFLMLKLLMQHATWQMIKAGTCLPGVVILFFWWFSGEVKHFVHLIRLNLNSRLCPCGLIWSNARLLRSELSSLNFMLLVPFSSPTSPPFGP